MASEMVLSLRGSGSGRTGLIHCCCIAFDSSVLPELNRLWSPAGRFALFSDTARRLRSLWPRIIMNLYPQMPPASGNTRPAWKLRRIRRAVINTSRPIAGVPSATRLFVRLLGSAGMGEVYLAQCPRLPRQRGCQPSNNCRARTTSGSTLPGGTRPSTSTSPTRACSPRRSKSSRAARSWNNVASC
jgi:hypothetical protein